MGTKFSLEEQTVYLIPTVNSAYSISTTTAPRKGSELSSTLCAVNLVLLCVAQNASIQSCKKCLLFLGTRLAVLAGHPQQHRWKST